MQIRTAYSMTGLLTLAAAAVFAAGCASATKEEHVTVSQLSEPARATLERVTAGGQVEKIDREVERGKVVYDVEATVEGKHLEYLIGDADGAVLGTEVPVEFGDLPEPVRVAAEKYFGTTSGLKAMKGDEYGETHYEVEGSRSGKMAEVTFNPAGERGD
jgi:uncharacterized membrane protein YkoI